MTEPITFAHREPVEALRRRCGHTLSSHAFASLYLWREEMGLSLYLTPALFSVRCTWRGPNAWFFPCGESAETEAFIRRGMEAQDFSLCYLRAADAAWLEEKFPGAWLLQRTPEADEYLYDAAGHLALRGGAYANMRTQVHKVEREYAPRVEWLGEENLPAALEIIRQWSHGHHRFDGCSLRDDQVDEEALILRQELGITGILLYVNGEPAAVTAGFFLADGIFDLAVAKGITSAQGVSYYAKRALMEAVGCTTVNLEEDLGIGGLRQMKNGLHPIGKNEIWEARRL